MVFVIDPTKPEPTPRELAEEIRRLQDELAWFKRDNEYRLDTLGMKRSWQTVEEHNITIDEPMRMDLYIPPGTKHIQSVILRLRLKPYEAYGHAWGTTAKTVLDTEPALWLSDPEPSSPIGSAGSHDHNGMVDPDGSHSHSLRRHVHRYTVPDHGHGLLFATFRSGTPKNVGIRINGVDVTAALGGPFNEDQESLDLTPFVQAIGWNDIEFRCGPDPTNDPPRGRIRASIFVELYLP